MLLILLVIVSLFMASALAGGGYYYYYHHGTDEEVAAAATSTAPVASAGSGGVEGSKIAVKVGSAIRLHNRTGEGHIYMTRPENTDNLKLFKKGAKVRFFNLQNAARTESFPEVTKTLSADVSWDMAAGSIYNSLKWDPVTEPASLPEHVLADVEVTL